MNPCIQNRKRIAWLAADALDPLEADDLRDHLDACPGCRHYWQEMADICRDHSIVGDRLPEIRPSASFHERLAARIRDDHEATAAALAVAFLRRWISGWRIAIPASAVALVAAVSLLRTEIKRVNPPSVAPARTTASAISSTKEVSPTYSAYRMAANTSLEALDELLARRSPGRSWATEVLSASIRTTQGVGD